MTNTNTPRRISIKMASVFFVIFFALGALSVVLLGALSVVFYLRPRHLIATPEKVAPAYHSGIENDLNVDHRGLTKLEAPPEIIGIGKVVSDVLAPKPMLQAGLTSVLVQMCVDGNNTEALVRHAVVPVHSKIKAGDTVELRVATITLMDFTNKTRIEKVVYATQRL